MREFYFSHLRFIHAAYARLLNYISDGSSSSSCNCVYCWGDYYLLSANVVAQYLYAKLEQVRVADLYSNTAPGGDSWSVQECQKRAWIVSGFGMHWLWCVEDLLKRMEVFDHLLSRSNKTYWWNVSHVDFKGKRLLKNIQLLLFFICK